MCVEKVCVRKRCAYHIHTHTLSHTHTDTFCLFLALSLSYTHSTHKHTHTHTHQKNTHLLSNLVVEGLYPSALVTNRCFVRHELTVVRTCIGVVLMCDGVVLVLTEVRERERRELLLCGVLTRGVEEWVGGWVGVIVSVNATTELLFAACYHPHTYKHKHTHPHPHPHPHTHTHTLSPWMQAPSQAPHPTDQMS